MQKLDHRVRTLIDQCRHELAAMERIWPHVEQQWRNGRHTPDLRGMPTSARGENLDDHSPPTYSDPTGEQVIHAAITPERDDKLAMLDTLASLRNLLRSSRSLRGRLEIKDADLTGRFNRQTVEVKPDDPWQTCAVCEKSFKRLVRGMCEPDWQVWLAAGRPDVDEWAKAQKVTRVTRTRRRQPKQHST